MSGAANGNGVSASRGALNIPSDLWQAAVESMPWFYPKGRRKRLRVEWHARFIPPGAGRRSSLDSYVKFQDLQNLADRRALDVRRKAVDLYADRQARVLKVLRLFIGADKSPAAEKRRAAAIRRMSMSPAEKEAVLNLAKEILLAPSAPPRAPASGEPVRRTGAAIRREGAWLDRQNEVDKFTMTLVKAALKGDAAAAKHLQGIAQFATMQLLLACRAKPDVFRPVAQQATLWPVIASTNPKWRRIAEQTLSTLNFGSETLYARVKPALAFDEHVPARRWARAAFETLEDNRCRLADPGEIERRLMFLRCDHEVQLRPVPPWAAAAGRLPPFSIRTAKKWAALSREMIRDEVPQLETHPDWAPVGRRFLHLKTTAGLVRNKVLDAIGSAMCSLAREALPKTGP